MKDHEPYSGDDCGAVRQSALIYLSSVVKQKTASGNDYRPTQYS